MSSRTKESFIKKGKWRTLETHWSSAKVQFNFQRPAGAKIRARYGVGWFSKNRQKKTLDGNNVKIISIGGWGVTRAKIQIKLLNDDNVSYTVVSIGPQMHTIPSLLPRWREISTRAEIEFEIKDISPSWRERHAREEEDNEQEIDC